MGIGDFARTGLQKGFFGQTGVINKEANRLGVGKRLGQIKQVGSVAMDIAETANAMGLGGAKTQAFIDAGTKLEDYGKRASDAATKAEQFEKTTRSAASGDTGAITSLALQGMQGAQSLKGRRK